MKKGLNYFAKIFLYKDCALLQDIFYVKSCRSDEQIIESDSHFYIRKRKQTNTYKKGGGRVIYDPRPSIMKKILLIFDNLYLLSWLYSTCQS